MTSAGKATAFALLSAALLVTGGCGAPRNHEAVVKDTISIVNQEADLLATVHDQASADAVIGRLKELNRKAMRLKDELQRMPPPTPEAQERLKGYQPEIADAVARFNNEKSRVEHEAGKGVLRLIDDAMRRPD